VADERSERDRGDGLLARADRRNQRVSDRVNSADPAPPPSGPMRAYLRWNDLAARVYVAIAARAVLGLVVLGVAALLG
jgi:hypothetical protein